jgi:hypothetical protein
MKDCPDAGGAPGTVEGKPNGHRHGIVRVTRYARCDACSANTGHPRTSS